MENHDLCTICNEPLQESIEIIDCVKVRGLQTLIAKSEEAGDGKWKH